MSSEEQNIWTGNPSQVVNLGSFIFLGLFFWLVVPLLIIIWKWLVIKNTRYNLTTQRLKTRLGVLNKHIDELELYRIQDYKIEQPLFLRLFSLSNIILETSDSSHPHFVLRAVPNGEQILDKIRFYVEECKSKRRFSMIDLQ